MEYYTDNSCNKFTVQLSNLITVLYLSLFTLQFTKDVQIFLRLNQCTHGQSDYGLSRYFKGPLGSWEFFDMHQNMLLKCFFLLNWV